MSRDGGRPEQGGDTQRMSEGPPNLPPAPEEDGQVSSRTCNGQDVCIGDAETPAQETPIATDRQDDAECLPWSPQLTEEEPIPPSVSLNPHNTHSRPSGPCWYCLRSLDSEHRAETPRQEKSEPLSPPPSSGEKMNYQTDPRPHFGVAWSSHSTCRPLWGSEGPCWGKRYEEVLDQTHTCPHCHLGLPPDTLRWHEGKCLTFEGPRNSKK
ncbi:uncharacterized protein [Antennarius striatus]|uniref:uncharacterized protein isoform X2 n=1 Tax=Antennarius striatus TaxID=241820 RepID=UPI0035B25B10